MLDARLINVHDGLSDAGAESFCNPDGLKRTIMGIEAKAVRSIGMS
jgi:hypothetical protein